jgi:hypothetical protein
MRRIDGRPGWVLNIGSGAVIIASATLVAVAVNRTWSWPLFIWGAVMGPVAVACSYYATKMFGRTLMQRLRDDAEREALASRMHAVGRRYAATYTGLLLVALGAGILSGGLRNPSPDIAFTTIWILAGVFPSVIARSILLRRLAAQSGGDDTNGTR